MRADAAREHVLHLMGRGANGASIARATGVAASTIQSLAVGDRTVVWRSVAVKILALKEAPLGYIRDATGSARKLRALGVIGYGQKDIGAGIGKSQTWISDIVNGRTKGIATSSAEVIDEFYRKHKDIPHPNPSPSTLGRARTQGWDGPWAWEGLDIDDPAVEPVKVDLD